MTKELICPSKPTTLCKGLSPVWVHNIRKEEKIISSSTVDYFHDGWSLCLDKTYIPTTKQEH